MPRAVADALFAHLLTAFPADRAYPRAAFERPPMPAPVAHFLVQTLQRRFDLEVEHLRAARSAWFAYDHPDLEAAHRAFVVALLQQARVPQAEWEHTLHQAVHLTTAFLVRPVPTLTSFLFDEGDAAMPAPVVYRRLNYFSAYPYLRAAVEAYFERKGTAEITRERFESLLARVDREMTEAYDADQWLGLVEPLLDVLRRVPDAGLPALRAFFEDKGASDVAARLDEAAHRGATVLDETGLRQILTPPEPATPEPAAPEAAEPAAPEPPEAPSTSEAPMPLWKTFMRAAEPDAPATEAPAGAVPLWMQFRTATDARTADLPALEQAILGEQAALDRNRFVTHLFSGSLDAYEQVLRLLLSAPTWTQASQIIARDVFKAHQVNIYSATAIAFTNAVEARYRQRAPRG